MLRIKYGLFVPWQEAESLIRTIDPAGVEERKHHRLKKKGIMGLLDQIFVGMLMVMIN